jgi:formylglycine-generating enzyme required for sulfatase activity
MCFAILRWEQIMNDMPRLKLIEIIAQYSKTVIDNPRQLEALLMDHCGECRREIHALMDAVRERIPQDLCTPGGTPLILLEVNLTKRLLNKRPMAEDMARWAVETWAIALGVAPQPSNTNQTKIRPLVTRRPQSPSALATMPQSIPQISIKIPLPSGARLTTPLSSFIGIIIGIALLIAFVGIFLLTRSLAAAPATSGTVTSMIASTIEVKMVIIPAGSFQMGSNQRGNGPYDDEKPIHTVTLNAFSMDMYEVTNADYAKCVSVGKCQPPTGQSSFTRKDYYTSGQYAKYPVMNVSWNAASTYCKWRGARLPTEAEWEKAARGGLEGKQYPWGDTAPVCTTGAENGAQFSDCPDRDTVTVGSFKPNGYGLYDMAGNVSEWVNDWYDYYSWSPGNETLDPTNYEKKVQRGGGYGSVFFSLRVASRGYSSPDPSNSGFRCVATPEN